MVRRAILAVEESTVSNSNSVAKIALLIAGIGSIAVAAPRAAAYFAIWMAGANLHPTPRINAFTVGFGMAPIPALAWVVYLWSRARPSGLLETLFRIVVSCVLVLAAGYCVELALFDALFVS